MKTPSRQAAFGPASCPEFPLITLFRFLAPLLIAEGLARCLDGDPKDTSLVILNDADLRIRARNKELSWKWYFTTAYQVTLLCVLFIAWLWLVRDMASQSLGRTAFEVLLGTLCGALGALLSVTSRGDRLVLDANAGEAIHQLEGLSRIGAGLIGAFIVGLALKAGLILGGTNFSGSKLALLLTFCVVAGASERLVPSLIENLSKVTTSKRGSKRS